MTNRLLHTSALAVALALVVLFLPLGAQSPTPAPAVERVEFEAASIKPNNSGIPRVALQFPGGRLNGINITVQMLLGFAFRLQSFQIVGAPDWVGSERYDVVATSTQTPTLDQRGGMVQALLVDRFKLTTHRETKELPIYALVLVRSDATLGPRIRKSDLDCAALAAAARGGGAPPAAPGQLRGCGSIGGNGQRTSRGVTMAEFATSLSGLVNRVVLNKTGLVGGFDFELQWAPDQFQGAGPLGGIPGAPPRHHRVIRRFPHCLRLSRSSSDSSSTRSEGRSTSSSSTT